ncbi:MAG: molybdenum cofactor biosynthesis protein MoaE [Crocinitomicaceae bacterium]|nr:molybdenum cofactor biosynthesis protein MoaE [Crocinitomicaceae bacterium]
MSKQPSVFFAICVVPLDIVACESFIRSTATGAEVIFVGTVRELSHGKKVVHLEFESYEQMAQKELQRITAIIKDRWSPDSILLHHRIGKVKPGEIAVIAAIAAHHREQAFEACSFLMDELKRTIPIWKKEVFEDGEEWVTPHP